MSEMSFPYGSSNHDRRYKSSDFRAYYAQMIGNGVYYSNADALKVREGEGMTVLLSIGGAFIDGVGYRNTSDLAFKLDTADGALSRIDRIVIRNDYKKRDTYAAVLKGTYSANPQAAALTRNADAYEIAVADVLVAKGVISITQAAITDTRLNNDLCGIVTGLIQQADTTEIFNQFTTFLNEFKQGHVAEFGDWTEEQKQEFVRWENGIKNILNENMAGNLLNMIGELKKLETTEKGNLVAAVNEVFISGSEKKAKLAENLAAMGVQASASDTWGVLLNKVLDMTDTSGDTVTASALLQGYTAHNAAGEQITGIIPERAGVTVDATATTQDDTYTYFDVPEGHYNAASKVRSANSNIKAAKLWLGPIVTSSGSQNTYTEYSNPVPFFTPLYCGSTHRGTSNIAGSISISSGVISYNLPYQYCIRSGSTSGADIIGRLGVIDASHYSVVATGNTQSEKTVSESLDDVIVVYTSASFASGSITDYSGFGIIPQPYPTAKKAFIVPKYKMASSNYDTGYMYFNYKVYKRK